MTVITILYSYGEGFPNVVAEAMACGTPCVVTDVGDAGFIVGKNGWVVPPKDPTKLANAIKKAISGIESNYWSNRRNKARSRIKENFNITKMIKCYNNLWIKVLKKDKQNIFNN
jgi:glycosyltransferase involved in cell wall biosynthesis